jgi:GNAT superfamily N-acetyltransferase
MRLARAELVQRKDLLHEEAERIALLQQRVLEAQDCEDYLANLPHFAEFHRKGMLALVQSCRGCPEEYLDWIMDLVTRNMTHIYDANWKWSVECKRHELSEYASNYLIATVSGIPIGFVHFRFEQQNDEFVVFLFDVQIEPEYQSRGLGTFLVTACEFIALERKAACVMTMVFTSSRAVNFFQKLGYVPHASSPEMVCRDEKTVFRHQILFKHIGRRKSAPK